MTASPPATQSSGGCFKFGCIIALVIAVTLFGGIYFYLRYSIKNAVLTYTEPSRVEVVRSESVTPEARADAAAKGAAQFGALTAQLSQTGEGGTPASFTFTPLQIEEIVRSRFAGVLGEGALVVEGAKDTLTLAISIPASPLVAFKDLLGPLVSFESERYFNGKATISVAVVDGTPKVMVKALTLAGKELPEMGLTSASTSIEGFLQEALAASPGVNLAKVKALSVVDGNVVMEVR